MKIPFWFKKRPTHEHVWRPSIYNHAPGKWCSVCGIGVNITEEEFYALFNRPSYAPSATPWPDPKERA